MRVGAHQPTPEPGPRATAGFPDSDRDFIEAGRRVGERFRLERPLVRRGRVWRALDDTGRAFALKTGERAVIEREYAIVAALGHPRIVAAHEFVAEGPGFIVFEELPGGDLVSLAGSAPDAWLPALADLVDALGYLHGEGWVHRDLKARNVRFDAEDKCRLIDFGSAAAIGSAWSSGGTTAETLRPGRGDDPVAAADDIYALAALVFELGHGSPPRSGRLRSEPPGALAGFDDLVESCLTARATAAIPPLAAFRAVIESLL